MTEVAFHFNAPDKLAYACRFARRAVETQDLERRIAELEQRAKRR